MAATITDLANAATVDVDNSATTGATVTATTSNNDWLVVIIGVDNGDDTPGASGAKSWVTGVTDSGGSNTYTKRVDVTYDPGANSEGATLQIYTCQVTANITNGTITANFSGHTINEIGIQVYRVRPGASEAISYISADTTGSGGLVTSHAAATVSVTSGDIIFGAASIETDDAVTGDSDTTNGSWSTVITRLADGGTDANAMCVSSQYKTVSATGNQSWACTTATARDSVRSYIILRSATAGKVLTADGGTYSVTGTAAALRRKISATGGTYAVTGSSVALRTTMPTAGGSYAVTGATTPTLHKWKPIADGGTYALTGSTVNLNKGQRLTLDAGTYSLSGTAASTLHKWKFTADGGTYTLTGTDASLKHGWKVAALGGSYSLTGSDVTFTAAANKVIAADGGSYSLTGSNAATKLGRKVIADPSSYAVTGTAAALRRNLPLTAGTSSYAVTGTTAATKLGRKVVALAGSYSVTGTDAGVRHVWKVAADSGTYAVIGTDAALKFGHKVAAGSGSYALTGSNASLLKPGQFSVVAGPGAYALTGSSITLTKTTALSIAADAGSYLVTGSDAGLIYLPTAPERPTRGEMPIDQETGRQRDKARQRRERAAQKDRRDLERMLQGLPPEPERDELEEVFAKAVEVSNTYLMMPDIPIQEIRAIEAIIQQIRVMLEAQALAAAHVQETVDLAQIALKRKSDEDAILALLLIG